MIVGVFFGLVVVGALGFAATAADGDVAEDAAFGPVAAAVLAEVAGLREVVVVVVAELGVHGVAARALQRLLVVLLVVVGPQPPVSDAASAEKSAAGSGGGGM